MWVGVGGWVGGGGLSCSWHFLIALSCSQQLRFRTLSLRLLFPTTVETVNDASVQALLTFDRFGNRVSLCNW